jgi:hypothetical protein
MQVTGREQLAIANNLKQSQVKAQAQLSLNIFSVRQRNTMSKEQRNEATY